MKELLEGQSLTLTATGSASEGTGVRTYIDEGAGALPSIGDAFYDAIDAQTYSSIVCTSITETPYFVNSSGDWKKKFIVNYASPDYAQTTGSVVRYSDDGAEEWEGGVASVAIQDPSGKWRAADTTVIATQDLTVYPKIVGSVVNQYATGTFTQTKVTNIVNAQTTINTFLGKVGKINNATFKGFAAGQVLLESMDAYSQQSPGGGQEQVVFKARFRWKVIGNGITSNDWQYAWDSNEGWIVPALGDDVDGGQAVTNPMMYETDDIDIF